MTRIWLLFFCVALSVAFKLHRPIGIVRIPYAKEYHDIPADVFYYHVFEHVIDITKAAILLSAIFWPIERKYLACYATFLGIEIIDLTWYRFYYRGWLFEDYVPWNVLKTAAFGSLTLYKQWK